MNTCISMNNSVFESIWSLSFLVNTALRLAAVEPNPTALMSHHVWSVWTHLQFKLSKISQTPKKIVKCLQSTFSPTHFSTESLLSVKAGEYEGSVQPAQPAKASWATHTNTQPNPTPHTQHTHTHTHTSKTLINEVVMWRLWCRDRVCIKGPGVRGLQALGPLAYISTCSCTAAWADSSHWAPPPPACTNHERNTDSTLEQPGAIRQMLSTIKGNM